MTVAEARHFRRYVALGDSSTEGLDDPDGRGGFRGWADRFAEHLAAHTGGIDYANLAVRGRKTRQILDEQLAPALAMRPDIATVFAGTNDVVRRRVDLGKVVADLETMQRALRGAGATVLTITLPDLSAVMPMAKRLAPRVEAMNEALRHVSAATGTILVDLARFPVASDPRLWSEDRLHANALGHARIAASLAHAIGLPGHGPEWQLQLPEPVARTISQNLAREAAWVRGYLIPWLWRHARGRSSGDGRQAKRPELSHLSPTVPGTTAE
jgi:lysophospholipase L1-like esterase